MIPAGWNIERGQAQGEILVQSPLHEAAGGSGMYARKDRGQLSERLLYWLAEALLANASPTKGAADLAGVQASGIPADAFTVNFVRLAGLDKHKARECETIARQVIAAHGMDSPRRDIDSWCEDEGIGNRTTGADQPDGAQHLRAALEEIIGIEVMAPEGGREEVAEIHGIARRALGVSAPPRNTFSPSPTIRHLEEHTGEPD
jgi:hypothetical protein